MRRVAGMLGLVAGFLLIVSVPNPLDAQGAPKFPTSTLTIISAPGERHTLTVEIARTEDQRAWGLMYRRELARDHGMLFVYPRVRRVAMWMKNTFIPLDMLFIGPAGHIRRIHRDAEPQSTATIHSRYAVKAVLEVRAGTVERLDLDRGDRVRHPVFGDG